MVSKFYFVNHSVLMPPFYETHKLRILLTVLYLIAIVRLIDRSHIKQ